MNEISIVRFLILVKNEAENSEEHSLKAQGLVNIETGLTARF
jgi:hypothetical protein